MANQWALLIGINQYTALQPLMYAQADAQALRNFFVDELGIPVDHCPLLADMATTMEPYAHPPQRQVILDHLQELCRDKVQPGDLLWVFFSGYGLTTNGQDYWLALDAEPTRLAETAIAVSTLFDILKTARTDQILLVMDMNRSQGAVGHHHIGQQTMTLAQDFSIATLLSCQPDQYAHETMAVRHGLFTKALLEGLRYHGCVTLSQLVAYLSDRVPELSQHHWRPKQNPVAVIPPEHKFMMVVPPEGIAKLPVTESAEASVNVAPELTVTPVPSPPVSSPPDLLTQPITPTPAPVPLGQQPPSPQPSFPETVAAPDERPAPLPPENSIVLKDPETGSGTEEEEGTWSGLWRWGVAAAAIAFLVGAFLRYQPTLLGRGTRTETPPTPTETAPGDTEAPSTPGEVPETGEGQNGETLFPEDIDPIEAGETALQRAEEAIAAGRYGEARAWLTQVPPELQNRQYESLREQANSQVAEAAVRNQSTLETARQVIQPMSASLFNDAIEQARQIPPEDPYYEQAQADIARWSRVILDLAEGRAASGDVNGAVAAASLVPEDQPTVYQLAQQRIATWQKQLDNQQLIRQVQSSLQPGQASSFNDAIRALQQITPDQPEYEAAQERIAQWSQDILAIARARAAQGKLEGAIAAAELVPEGTAAYEQAQQEIQRWQGQL